MITADGYSLEYFPKGNRIVIYLPQTYSTITNTVDEIANRRIYITDAEKAAILMTVKAIMEG